MNFKRYIIQFLDSSGNGTHFHCIGLPKDPTDISYAYLMDDKALKKAVEKNCIRWVGTYTGGSKVTIPHRILEVNCSVSFTDTGKE